MCTKYYFLPIFYFLFSIILSAQSHTWNGNGGDTDWFNVSNWDVGTLPTGSSDVFIPTGFSVEIINAIASANSIDIDGVSTLHIENDLNIATLLSISETSDLIWLKGTILGGGTIENIGSIQIESQEYKEFVNMTLNNHGSIVFTNTNLTRASNSTVINNLATGIIEIDSVGGWTQEDIGNTLNNFGIIRKINSSGLSNFYLIFDIYNSGIIEVEEEQALLILGNSIVLDNQTSGLLQGSGVFDITANFTNSGTFSPGGQGIGKLEVINNFSFPTEATLQIDIAGSNNGEYDVVEVFGFPELDGNIAINLSYVPQIGEEFTIFTANDITSCNLSDFVTASFNGTDYTFMITCNATDVKLSVIENTIGINDASTEKIDFYLFPNPTTDIAQFVYPLELLEEFTNVTIVLFDYSGKEITKLPLSSIEATTLDLSNLSSGQYIAYLIADNEILSSTKILAK